MPKVLSWEKNGLIQNFRYFSKITVPVRTVTIVIVPVRSISLRTLHTSHIYIHTQLHTHSCSCDMFKLTCNTFEHIVPVGPSSEHITLSIIIFMYDAWTPESAAERSQESHYRRHAHGFSEKTMTSWKDRQPTFRYTHVLPTETV